MIGQPMFLEPVAVVSLIDTALDMVEMGKKPDGSLCASEDEMMSASRMAVYRDHPERDDCLILRPGATATRFTLRPLTNGEQRRLEIRADSQVDYASPSVATTLGRVKWEMAFAAALVAVESLREPGDRFDRDEMPHADWQALIDELARNRPLVRDLGQRALAIASRFDGATREKDAEQAARDEADRRAHVEATAAERAAEEGADEGVLGK